MAVIRMKGVKIKNLDQLRENFDFTNAKDYLLQGTLSAWMREHGETDIADKLSLLTSLECSDQELAEKFCDIMNISPEQCFVSENKHEQVEKENKEDSPAKSVSFTLNKLSEAQVDNIRKKVADCLDKTNKTAFQPFTGLANKVYWDSLSPAEQKQAERLSYIISLFRKKEKKDIISEIFSRTLNTAALAADYSGMGKEVHRFMEYEITADSHLQSDLGFTKEEQEIRFEKIRRKYNVVLDDLSSDPTIEDVCVALEADLFGTDSSRRIRPINEETKKQILLDLEKANRQLIRFFLGSRSNLRIERLENIIFSIKEHIPQTALQTSVNLVDLQCRLISGYGLLPEDVNAILDKLKEKYQVNLSTLPFDPNTEEICLAIETELEQ